MKKIKSQKGSIALISLLLISVVSMILALGISETSISTSYQYLNNSSSKEAYYVAEGCLEEVLTRLEQNADFGGTTLNIDLDTSCTAAVTGGASLKTVTIVVDKLNYSQTFQGTVDLTAEGVINNADLSNWKEI